MSVTAQNGPLVDDKEGPDDNSSMNSSDEALCEMLGINSFGVMDVVSEETMRTEQSQMEKSLDPIQRLRCMIQENNEEVYRRCSEANEEFLETSVCVLPSEASIPAEAMRCLTDQLVWDTTISSDRSYETIQVWKDGVVVDRRTLTRLENFVDNHEVWNQLCHTYIARCVSAVVGESMVLFKEKLNLKPPGGSGFAPHLDAPSLRVALGSEGPQSFVTVMIAIDNMTVENGCLRVARGKWSEENSCSVVSPKQDGNPDGNGRAGAISAEIANELDFEDVVCKGGSIVAFNGWVPHRSGANKSPFPRRAAFLTYNPASEGSHHKAYYDNMESLRSEWRNQVGLTQERKRLDEQQERDALATIPRI